MAPAAVHIPQVLSSLRKDFSVAAQNCWVKGGGAFTGELRCGGVRWVRDRLWVGGRASVRGAVCLGAMEAPQQQADPAAGKGSSTVCCVCDSCPALPLPCVQR